VATDDEKLQMALDIFRHFGINPGQGLLPHNFITVAAKNDWQHLDVIDGVKLGYAKGFFDDGPNYELKLTGDGFAAISAPNETIQTGTISNTHDTNEDKPLTIFDLENDR
jgi:hypothetical protein